MPTQPPHHVSSQKSQNPHPPRSVGPYYAKRTQFTPTATLSHAKNAKRTQSPPAHDQKCETNPICPHGHPAPRKKYETNPIPGPMDKILRTDDYMLKTAFNKTNPIPARPTANRQQPKAVFMETNPKNNAGRRPAAPIFNPHGSGGHAHEPKMRNEPNLPRVHHPPTQKIRNEPNLRPAKKRNEPNSHIPGVPPLRSYPSITQNEPNFTCPRPANNQKMRNEPNFACPTPRQPPKNAKRTQSPPNRTKY